MDVTKLIDQLINQVLTDVFSTIKDIEKVCPNFGLFQWKLGNRGFIPEITDESISVFFEMILVCRHYEKSADKSVEVEEQEYKNLLDNFFEDVIMSVLNDAIINIIEHFSLKRQRNKYPELVDELFFSYDSFENQVKDYISIYDYSEKEELLSTIDFYSKGIEYKIPKIVFPWYVYALIHTHKYLGERLKIIKEKHLALMWSKSEYPNEDDLFITAQRRFQAFISSLKLEESRGAAATFNKSLNLYLFNETTNLYDIYNVVNNFKRDSPYIKYQELQSNSINEMGRFERYKRKKEIFDGVGKIARINNLGVKTFLIDNHYSKTLFENKEVWNCFNQIFENCKMTLVSFVKESGISLFESELEDVPEAIRLDIAIYRIFSKEDPFKEFAENILNDGLPAVYKQSNNSIETHLFEAYSYVYKSFYKSRFKGK